MAMNELSPGHVRSGNVMTVQGPVPVSDIGVTLMHEHILNDCRCWWHAPKEPERQYLAEGFVCMEILGELRQDPFVNKHNITLDDEKLAVTELKDFAGLGGQTVVEPTCQGIGRDPLALRRISKATGLNIVMGAGFYLGSSHPKKVASMSVGQIADEIVSEAVIGADGTDVRIGLIGEIGVSSDFTAEEEKSLRGAAQAQVRTGLPLMVHLPGWFRLGHRVLDVVASEGGDLRHTVLCHMNPSYDDLTYQSEIAARGAFLEYDMIGMDFFYADQQVQCPSDEEAARALVKLVEMGHTDRLLLSHDVFLKMMLKHYGGNGYAYILRHFLPRLKRHGLDDATLDIFMRANPRSVFQANVWVQTRKRNGNIMTKKVLLVGESWVSSATHYKGFDQFGSVTFHLGAEPLVKALKGSAFELTYMPAHEAVEQFPFEMAGLDGYDAIILSDIGANSLLLPPAVWLHSKTVPNRLKLIKAWVENGGGLLMVGGYFSFQGIDGKARWRRTPVEEVLPVTCLPYDDRVEIPEGTTPVLVKPAHETVAGLSGKWPLLLGVNEVEVRERDDVEVIARLPDTEGGHPLLVTGRFGKGRTAAWTSDIGPHWLSPAFCEWEGYGRLWKNILGWLTEAK